MKTSTFILVFDIYILIGLGLVGYYCYVQVPYLTLKSIVALTLGAIGVSGLLTVVTSMICRKVKK